MKKVICISGYKNSGKTTLIQKLLVVLNIRGIPVSVIKHDGHLFDIPNSDTERFHQSGCNDIVIFDDMKSMHIYYEQSSIESLIESMEHDLVFIEGMKQSTYPKLYIENGLVYPNYEDRTYSRDDIDGIVNSILKFTKISKNDTL